MSLKNKSAAITTQSGWLDGECAVQVFIQKRIDCQRAEQHHRKRGISNQKACMITGVERRGEVSLLTTNMAKPTSDDIRKIMPTIEDETSVFIDPHAAHTPSIA